MAVYVIGCEGSRLVKIGCAGDVRARIQGIGAMSPVPVKLLWESHPEYGVTAERHLHHVFRDYRQHGEWFDFGDSDPVGLVEVAMKGADREPDTKAPPRGLTWWKVWNEIDDIAARLVPCLGDATESCRCPYWNDHGRFGVHGGVRHSLLPYEEIPTPPVGVPLGAQLELFT